MHKRVKLSDVLEAMEFQSDLTECWFDCQTGRIERVSEENLIAVDDELEAEEEDAGEVPEWRRESLEIARALEADTEDRFIALPDGFEIDEWDMMRRFAEREVDDPNTAQALSNAIRGKGAFRYFKDEASRLGLADQWYAYRDAQYREIAVDWCQRNGIAIELEDPDDTPPGD